MKQVVAEKNGEVPSSLIYIYMYICCGGGGCCFG